ncbi:hypothetical protein E3Q08_04153, partial [Wallemia mellicola]
RGRLTRGEHGGDATWANGATSNTAATSGSSENSDGDLLRRGLKRDEWANGATSNSAATSGESKHSDGDLLKRKLKRDDWATGATSSSSAGSGSFDHNDGDLLKRGLDIKRGVSVRRGDDLEDLLKRDVEEAALRKRQEEEE